MGKNKKKKEWVPLDLTQVQAPTDQQQTQLPTLSRSRQVTEIDIETLPAAPPFKAFVGNLHFETDGRELKAFFSERGCDVVDATIALDPKSGAVRGFGYVEFASRMDLKKALELDGEQLHNRAIRVDKSDRSGRGGDRDGDDRRGPRGRYEDKTPGDWRRERGELPPPRERSDRGERGDRGERTERPPRESDNNDDWRGGERSQMPPSSQPPRRREPRPEPAETTADDWRNAPRPELLDAPPGLETAARRPPRPRPESEQVDDWRTAPRPEPTEGAEHGEGRGSQAGGDGREGPRGERRPPRDFNHSNNNNDAADWRSAPRLMPQGDFSGGGGGEGHGDRQAQDDRDYRGRGDWRGGGEGDWRGEGRSTSRERRNYGRRDEGDWHREREEAPVLDAPPGLTSPTARGPPKLALSKRTVPANSSGEAQAKPSAIFGGAKPVDTSKKLLEVEKKLDQEEEQRRLREDPGQQRNGEDTFQQAAHKRHGEAADEKIDLGGVRASQVEKLDGDTAVMLTKPGASKEERPVSNAFAGLTLDDDDDEEEEEQATGEADETKAEE